ncbi:MAG: hypothetical protein ACO20H_06330 [Bacteriovoracaceae bacterium]
MELSKLISPDISGIFWFTETLKNSSQLGNLDYIFNGLLSLNTPKDEDPSLFFTENFANKIFLYHFPSIEMKNHFTRAFEIISKNNLETRKFIIINETEKNWSGTLSQKYSNYTFIDYTN